MDGSGPGQQVILDGAVQAPADTARMCTSRAGNLVDEDT